MFGARGLVAQVAIAVRYLLLLPSMRPGTVASVWSTGIAGAKSTAARCYAEQICRRPAPLPAIVAPGRHNTRIGIRRRSPLQRGRSWEDPGRATQPALQARPRPPADRRVALGLAGSKRRDPATVSPPPATSIFARASSVLAALLCAAAFERCRADAAGAPARSKNAAAASSVASACRWVAAARRYAHSRRSR
jgi:hypothetical protein